MDLAYNEKSDGGVCQTKIIETNWLLLVFSLDWKFIPNSVCNGVMTDRKACVYACVDLSSKFVEKRRRLVEQKRPNMPKIMGFDEFQILSSRPGG